MSAGRLCAGSVDLHLIDDGEAELCTINTAEKSLHQLEWGIKDFDTFFEELLNTRAIENWLAGIGNFAENLLTVFPDADVSRYKMK